MIITDFENPMCNECNRLQRVHHLKTWLNLPLIPRTEVEKMQVELEQLESIRFNHTCELGWS